MKYKHNIGFKDKVDTKSKEKILVTGCAGFIGMHLCKSLLDDGYYVYGVDSINEYYDSTLKVNRLKILKNYSTFSFSKLDITELNKLFSVFEDYKPSKVINLAAQAGVRYSIENPHTYIDSNIKGFMNILECCRKYNIKGLVYASSSSVYGGNTKIPFSENDRVDNPISIYAVSKVTNELMAHTFNKLYGLRSTGLRFFTVYGPWGRPDMAMYIFTNKILNDEPIDVFNFGKMERDFTYIDDIVLGVRSAIDKNYENEIFNLGNSKVENLLNVISNIESELNCKAKINYKPIQLGDVEKTYSDITRAKNLLGFNPTVNINIGIKKFIKWYKEYNNFS